jgi:hypothetical protein
MNPKIQAKINGYRYGYMVSAEGNRMFPAKKTKSEKLMT